MFFKMPIMFNLQKIIHLGGGGYRAFSKKSIRYIQQAAVVAL